MNERSVNCHLHIIPKSIVRNSELRCRPESSEMTMRSVRRDTFELLTTGSPR